MNKFILNTMNRKNLTEGQLNDNTATANAYASAAAADDAAKYWLVRYFEESNESRADYEAELERDSSFREVK